MNDNNEDRIAALEREIEKLKAAAKPPEPIKTDWTPINPIDRLSMSREATMAMVNAEPAGFMRGVVHDNRAPQGPSTPGVGSGPVGNARVPAGVGGWAREIEFGPSHHQRYVDQQLDAQDRRDRAERIEQERRLKAMEGK